MNSSLQQIYFSVIRLSDPYPITLPTHSEPMRCKKNFEIEGLKCQAEFFNFG